MLKNRFIKNSPKLILLCLAVILLYQVLFFFWKSNQKVEFYPYDPHPTIPLSRIYKFFRTKQFSMITSYIEQLQLKGTSSRLREQLLFWQAESFFQMQQYEFAQREFTSLLNEYPKFWQAQLRLGILKMIGQNSSADFLQIIKKIPPCNELFYWQGKYFESLNNISKAFQSYYQGDPKEIRFALALGNLYFSQGNENKALFFLLPLINEPNADSDKAEILRKIFIIYSHQKDFPNMVKYSNALKPYLKNDINMVRSLAKIFYELGDVAHASDLFSIFDTDADITPYIARTLLQLNFELHDYPRVLKYARYIDLDQSNILPAAQSAYALKQYQTVVTIIKRFIEGKSNTLQDDKRPAVLNLLANAYREMKQYGSAQIIYESIEKIKPSLENHYNLMAMYHHTGKHKQLNQIADSVYDQSPQDIEPLLKVLFSYQEYDQAQSLLSKALESHMDENLLLRQAELYSLQENWGSLRTSLYRLIQLPPENKQVRYQANYALGSLDLQEKNYPEAEELLSRAKQENNTKEVNIKLMLAFFFEDKTQEARAQINFIRSEFSNTKTLTDEDKNLIYKVDKLLVEEGTINSQIE